MSASESPIPSPLSPDVESRPGLLRVLGLGMALSMVVGNVIGSGIFLKPGQIAADTGQFSLIISAWVLGGGLCLLGGLCFAELAVMLPQAGGLYVYLREAYGRPVAFLFGWTEFLLGRPASIGALSVAFIGALGAAIDVRFEIWGTVLMALLLVSLMAWVNILGVIWGGRVQALTTLIKAGFLGALALLPFALYAAGYSGFESTNYGTSVAPAKLGITAQFAAAMLGVMWAYNGWHAITPVAEEVREPRRNIPLALFGGIGILIVLYVSANFAYHGVLTMEEMAAAGDKASQTMVRKLMAPFGESVARFGVGLMSAVIMCSTFGAINSTLLNGPRISFAMGRDDVFFRLLGRVHVNYRTPAAAIVVQAALALVLLLATCSYVSFEKKANSPSNGLNATATEGSAEAESHDVLSPVSSVFDMLTNFVVFSASIFYMLAVAAVMVLRKKHPDWDRPYRTLGYPLVPIAYLSFYAWFLYNIFIDKPFEAKVGLALVLLGLPVYYAWRAWARRHPEVMHDGM